MKFHTGNISIISKQNTHRIPVSRKSILTETCKLSKHFDGIARPKPTSAKRWTWHVSMFPLLVLVWVPVTGSTKLPLFEYPASDPLFSCDMVMTAKKANLMENLAKKAMAFWPFLD